MLKIGLTGNIGVGKTTISKIFKELGIPIFNSDLFSREAENELYIKQGFKNVLGEDIYVDGELDRDRMRKMIFTDRSLLSKIQGLVLPYVTEKFDEFSKEHKDEPYIILESAIIFETDSQGMFDYIITVIADDDIRIKRVLARDKTTLEEVQNKINNQFSQDTKIFKSNFIIENNGEDLINSLSDLDREVLEVHSEIIRLIAQKKLKENRNGKV